MTGSVGLAVFVKTPGLSSVKTRLAEIVGPFCTAEFYEHALASVEVLMTQLKAQQIAQPYWAIAESAALTHPRWKNHARLHQGDGDLGSRLARVVDQLFQLHHAVLVVGSDSPQLTSRMLADAVAILRRESQAAHVMGRCHDGGFYLVGSNRRVPAEVWQEITYSTDTTAHDLEVQLGAYGPIYHLPLLNDVDRHADLAKLLIELQSLEELTPAQHKLLKWLEVLPVVRSKAEPGLSP